MVTNEPINENDILDFTELLEENIKNENFLSKELLTEEIIEKDISDIKLKPDNIINNVRQTLKNQKKVNDKEKFIINIKKIFSGFTFIFRYILTSIFIFAFLLLTTNYSAYTSILKNYVYKDEAIKTQQSLISSVKASVIKERVQKKENIKKMFRNKKDLKIKKDLYKSNIYSMSQLMNKANREDINISIDISPYENRIVIPKIWKNIPLIDIKRKLVSWKNELNDIFMKELKNWVIRYPWSIRPWKEWNTFIFWHSSNFPWVSWKYNEVFALLDKLSFDDEIIVYYWQEKFTYKIREKKVIKPWNVWVLKNEKWKKKITLMTCWPIWTTLNRLIVVWELIE